MSKTPVESTERERLWSIGPHDWIKAKKKLEEEFKDEPSVLMRIKMHVEPYEWWWL